MPARTTLSVLLIQLGLLCFAQSTRNVRGVSRDEATSSLYTQLAPTENVTSTAPVVSLPTEKANLTTPKPRAFDPVRDFIKKNIASAGRNLTRNLLRARLSTSCIVGVTEFIRAVQELEPWALRIVDATAKYPSGMLQATTTDIGAYDECIETVVKHKDGSENVRAQYCNLYIGSNGNYGAIEEVLPALAMTHKRTANFTSYLTDDRLPGLRFGICFIIFGNKAKMTVKDCVTNRPEPINKTQLWILAALGATVVLVILSTAFELTAGKWEQQRKNGACYKALVAFSVIDNTRVVVCTNNQPNSEAYAYKFIHGMRFLGIFWIVLGHSYGTISENFSRLANALVYFEHWESVIVTAGYQAVDMFFFLSGFLLYYTLNKQTSNRAVVAVVAIVRRFIRATVPTFFMIMCIYVLPLIASGPNSKAFFTRFYGEIHEHWWAILLQVRNWRTNIMRSVLPHIWYLSADFQLFVISVLVIQVFKAKKWLTVAVFAALSLTSCALAAWQIYGTHMMPFMIPVVRSLSIVQDTVDKSYAGTFYHGVCFFSGCITFVLTQKFGRKARISALVQGGYWCVALSCGLYSVFMKCDWYRSDEPATEAIRMVSSFADRILWSLCMAWFVFACTTGRAGPVARFLAWDWFVPLSRLSFGVYLIHSPLYIFSHHIARERIFFSHYTLVSQCFAVFVWSNILSYLLFITCDAPTGHLEKLVFMPVRPTHLNGDAYSNVGLYKTEDEKTEHCRKDPALHSCNGERPDTESKL
ncbi:nose resistant to fluoxetine protein 6-like isoform X2 [Haemaphysalis longicornis]